MSADADNTLDPARESRARTARMRTARVRLWMAATLAFLVILLATTWGGYTLYAGYAKAIASLCFIMVAVTCRATSTRYGQLILAGLVLSWFGDVFLISREQNFFLSGLVSFLLAHVAYTVAFAVHGIRPRWSALAAFALAPVISFVLRWLLPHVGDDMKIPVFAYMIVITLMVLFSWGARGTGLHISAPIGAMLFFVSDIAVTRSRFVVPESMDWLWGLPLYYIAQLFLAYSVVTVIQRGSETVEDEIKAIFREKKAGPKYRLHFAASFLVFLVGFALALLMAMLVSIFTLTSNDSLFKEWFILPVLTGTYGIIIAVPLGALFRLMSFYRLTENDLVRVSLFGKRVEIPLAQISNVERVHVFRFFGFPVYRIRHEKSDRPLYFVNWISKRKFFDACIIEYTEDLHPLRILLRNP